MLKGILWSAVCRNGIILAEAGEDNRDGAVIELAQKLLQKKKATHGWDFENSRRLGLRGIKFYVYDEETNINEFNESSSELLIWSFLVVADKSLEEEQVKSFIEKLVYITMPMREDDLWRKGELLCAQNSFAPILLHQMEQVDEVGRLAMVNEKVNTTKEIMAENIEMALERDNRLQDLKKTSEQLNVMAKQFKKRSEQVKRFKMIQNAKHGIMVGTAVTAATAIVVVPLVALL